MYRDIQYYVTSCTICVTKKMLPNKNMGTLGAIIATRPWEVVGSDMLISLPLTAKGN